MKQFRCIRALSPVAFACLAFVAVLVLSVPQAQAQVLYGSIVGNVKDQSEAAIPGAEVIITHQGTNQSRQSITDDTGAYSFATIPAGPYSVKVVMPGFKEFVKTDVPVTINNVSRVDVLLQVGEVTETLTVTSETALLQTESSEVKAEIGEKSLQDLPVFLGRNYQFLFDTLAGIENLEDAHSIPTNPSRSLAFNANGTTRSSNDIRIDGAGQYDIWLPHITAYIPSLESIETVNVVTNSFKAEQGLAGGAAVNVRVKSGTNELHGSAFEYNTNNGLMAKPFFHPPRERNPKYIMNQFGGSFGGPIKKEKVFYFLSYEGTRERQFASGEFNIPDMKMRTGDLSGSANPIHDPLTGTSNGSNRTAFAGKIIPANRIHPISKKILDLMPAPTFSGSLSRNYFATGRYAFDRNTLDAKIDWHATSKFNMYGRLSILRYTMDAPTVFGDTLVGVQLKGGNPGHGWGGTYGTTIAGTYVFSPNFVADANFGYTRKVTNVEQARLDEKVGLDFLKIPGTNGPRRFEGGWPRIRIDDFAEVGITTNFMPYYRRDPQRQVAGSANWTRSKHNVRFGGEFVAQHMNQTQPEFPGAQHPAQGGFRFQGGVTTVRGGPGSTNYNSFAAFLLGLPRGIGRILQVDDEYTTRARFYSMYAQDAWSVTRRLQFNFGTRWEYLPMPTRADRGVERYDFVNNKMLVCGVGDIPKDCGVKLSKTLFAPRIGFTYRATDTFVIRAGYGLTNDPFSLARPHRTNHPMLLALNITSSDSRIPLGSYERGIPPVAPPPLGNGIIEVGPNIAINSVGPEFDRGYIQSWNLALQKKIFWNFTGEVAYVATRSIRQLGYRDLNAGQVIGAARAGQPYFQKFGRNTDTRLFGPAGHSIYDALQAKLERRFNKGWQFNANYTWSKSIGIVGITNSDNTPRIEAFDYYHLNRSVSNIHTPHRLNINTIWELPFGRGKSWLSEGFGAAALGGWQANLIMRASSGRPFSITADGTSLNMPGNDQRADQIKPKVEKLKGVGRGQAWFDVFAFAPVPRDEARFGTLSFNSMLGPKQFNLDFGIFRVIRITEGVTLTVRAEGFNFTNTPHLDNPGSGGGTSTSVSRLQVNPKDGTVNLNGFGEIGRTRNTGREGLDQRIFRFGLRLGF